MFSREIRRKFLDYFKKRGHKIMSSSSLIPDNDPSVLLTTAGMQQFVEYLAGTKIPPSKRLCSIQKCFRTVDIEEIGDETHHTFFEMLGNWSIGDYFKKESCKYALEFLTKECKVEFSRLWVTVFKGEKGIPKDKESIKIWQDLGIPKEKIKESGMESNFWGPAGKSGPCGPSTEIHYDRGKERGCKNKKDCGPNCPKCSRFLELWNLVFMEYNKDQKGNFNPLPQKNVDTGMGLERLCAILQNKESNFDTDLFQPLMLSIVRLIPNIETKENQIILLRIIADHVRGAVFLVGDGVIPSREERGYILRRIIRRAVRYGRLLGIKDNFLEIPAMEVIKNYSDFYPYLKKEEKNILKVIIEEEEKFKRTLEKGLKLFEKITKNLKPEEEISGLDTFHLYDTFGFPLELTCEMAQEKNLVVNKDEFREAFRRHQKISRAGVEKKFGGVGKLGKKVARQHTATHLLHQALREVLGKHVRQAGSDLTEERLRFDFIHPKPMTKKEIEEVEDLVNQRIKKGLEIISKEMDYKKALKSGALAFFKEKYPKRVTIYSIVDPRTNKIYSKEICAGPHVKNTNELGNFKILKEKSSGAGVRRIKAILE